MIFSPWVSAPLPLEMRTEGEKLSFFSLSFFSLAPLTLISFFPAPPSTFFPMFAVRASPPSGRRNRPLIPFPLPGSRFFSSSLVWPSPLLWRAQAVPTSSFPPPSVSQAFCVFLDVSFLRFSAS